MADTNSNGQRNNADADGNEISRSGKIRAGFLLVSITAFMVLMLIAHWPNKMPDPTARYARYSYEWFHVTLVDQDGKPMDGVNTDSAVIRIVGMHKDSLVRMEAQADSIETVLTDTATKETAADSTLLAIQADTLAKKISEQKTKMVQAAKQANCKKRCTIDLNTLIMILVAIAGFLSNMIHIASSFTNFIGEGKFKRSWILWYFVKPFTASALALAVYVIFRAGFLNASDVATNVNLYGVVAIAILAGLFTDMATLKLKEVFGVIFNTTTQRRDRLETVSVTITGLSPKELVFNQDTPLVISGTGFDSQALTVKINGLDVPQTQDADANALYITYKATTTSKQKLTICDDKGKVLASRDVEVTGSGGAEPPAPAEPAASTVTAVDPTSIAVDTDAVITLTGTGLDAAGIKITMGGQPVTPTSTSATEIKIAYKATAAGTTELLVADAAGNELTKETITAAAG